MAVSVCLVGFVDGLELEGACGLAVGLCEGAPCPTVRRAGNDLGHILPLVELGLVFDQLVEDGDLDFPNLVRSILHCCFAVCRLAWLGEL